MQIFVWWVRCGVSLISPLGDSLESSIRRVSASRFIPFLFVYHQRKATPFYVLLKKVPLSHTYFTTLHPFCKPMEWIILTIIWENTRHLPEEILSKKQVLFVHFMLGRHLRYSDFSTDSFIYLSCDNPALQNTKRLRMVPLSGGASPFREFFPAPSARSILSAPEMLPICRLCLSNMPVLAISYARNNLSTKCQTD